MGSNSPMAVEGAHTCSSEKPLRMLERRIARTDRDHNAVLAAGEASEIQGKSISDQGAAEPR